MRPASIALLPREPPRPAVAVAALGPARTGLATAAVRRLTVGAELRAAAGDDWLVVLGATDDLPWADGCRWLGREDGLLLPTTATVRPSADLVARALRGDTPPVASGLLVLLEDVVLVGPAPAGPADPARLRELR